MPEAGARWSPERSAASARGRSRRCSSSARSRSGTTSAADDSRLRLVLSDGGARPGHARRGRRHGRRGARARARRARDHARRPPRRSPGAVLPRRPARGARVNVYGTVVVFETVQGAARPDPRPRLRELDGGLHRLRPVAGAGVGRDGAVHALRGLQARERGHGARVLGGRGRRLDRDPAVRRLRAGAGSGADLRPVARDGGGRARRGLRDRATAGPRSTTSRPTSAARSRSRRGRPTEGAHVANFPGESSTMEEVVAAIEAAAPRRRGRITWHDERPPVPRVARGDAPRAARRPAAANVARGRRPPDDRALRPRRLGS